MGIRLTVYKIVISVIVLSALVLNGCYTSKNIPRDQYQELATKPEAQVITTDGRLYKVKNPRIAENKIIGTVNGVQQEFGVSQVMAIRVLSLDRFQTVMLGIIGVCAVSTIVLTISNSQSSSNS